MLHTLAALITGDEFFDHLRIALRTVVVAMDFAYRSTKDIFSIIVPMKDSIEALS